MSAGGEIIEGLVKVVFRQGAKRIGKMVTGAIGKKLSKDEAKEALEKLAEQKLAKATRKAKGLGKAHYSSIRAYKGVKVEKIPLKYRADPRLVTETKYKGKGASSTNAAGWERDTAKHFGELLDKHPEYWSKANVARIERGIVPVVDDAFVKHFPQYKDQMGDKLIHHHIGGGGQATSVPESLHKGFGGIHNVEKKFGIRGNDPTPKIDDIRGQGPP